ncbi:hypothetical protein AVEN_234586-1, partial [Araneus ventricosus]
VSVLAVQVPVQRASGRPRPPERDGGPQEEERDPPDDHQRGQADRHPLPVAQFFRISTPTNPAALHAGTEDG